MGRLDGKIALVTGAASGIGRATAERFAEEGATVLLADKAEDRLADACTALPGSHLALPFDVTDEAAWMRAAAEIEQRFGRLDVLVNNAGYGRFSSIAETSLAEWRAVVAVNLDSVFLGTKSLLPLLARSGRGAIVNVASIRAVVAGRRNTGAYCAAKAGVRMFTKSTALECAEAGNGIRANCVLPGHVDTPLTARHFADPEVARSFTRDIPLGRIAAPRELAEAIVFLASDESSFMTGADMIVDGGFSAH